MNPKTVRRMNKLARVAERTSHAGEAHAARRKIAQITRVPRAYGLMEESDGGSFDTYA